MAGVHLKIAQGHESPCEKIAHLIANFCRQTTLKMKEKFSFTYFARLESEHVQNANEPVSGMPDCRIEHCHRLRSFDTTGTHCRCVLTAVLYIWGRKKYCIGLRLKHFQKKLQFILENPKFCSFTVYYSSVNSRYWKQWCYNRIIIIFYKTTWFIFFFPYFNNFLLADCLFWVRMTRSLNSLKPAPAVSNTTWLSRVGPDGEEGGVKGMQRWVSSSRLGNAADALSRWKRSNVAC